MRHTKKIRALGNAVMQSLEHRTLRAAELVFDAQPGSFGADPASYTAVGSTIYFRAFEPNTGIELYKTDGTAAGTLLVKDINPWTENSNFWPDHLTNVNGSLFFTHMDPDAGRSLFMTNGTAAGTVRLAGLGQYDHADDLVAVGSTLFFVAE